MISRPAELREAHAHIASFGESLALPALGACDSARACLEEVRRCVDGGAGWIRCHSARVEAWPERRWPLLAELDAATGERPCVLLSIDHHSAMANTAALRVAGVEPGQRIGRNGLVCADPTSGGPTGVLLEEAAQAVWDRAARPTAAELTERVALALDRLRSFGYAEVHDMHAEAWLGPSLAALEAEGRLPTRVVLYAPIAELQSIAAGRERWESDRISLAGGKVFADGALNSRTALMLDDYVDPVPGMPRGMATVTPEELRAHIALADTLGLPLAIHAIGDAAVRMVLDSIERTRPRTPGYRIEHCQFVDEADVERFARLGVAASMQPCHLLTDIEPTRALLPHREHRAFPIRELIDSGLRPGREMLFGSDVPIVGPAPEDSIVGATLRRRRGMDESEALAPAQAIGEDEAWACFGGA